MPIGPYDQFAMAKYTPLSAQEILMPAQYMRERHDQMEDALSIMGDELEKVSVIAATDPVLSEKVNAYRNSLNDSISQLSAKGVTSNTRRNALALKTQYAKNINPILQAYTMRSEASAIDKQRRMQDQTYRGENPDDLPLSSIIDKGLTMPDIRGASGAMVTKQVAEYLTPYKNKRPGEFTSAELEKMAVDFRNIGIDGQTAAEYTAMIQHMGYDPNTPAGQALVEVAKANSFRNLGIANPNVDPKTGRVVN